jgi:hypothetical protein
MHRTQVDSGAEIASQVSKRVWRQTLLTAGVLAVCLGLIAVMAIF